MAAASTSLRYSQRCARAVSGVRPGVYATEPADPAPFEGLENVVLTPHYGSGTPDTRREMNEMGLRNLQAFFAGKPLITPVG